MSRPPTACQPVALRSTGSAGPTDEGPCQHRNRAGRRQEHPGHRVLHSFTGQTSGSSETTQLLLGRFAIWASRE